MNSIQPFILASSSPRRKELLADAGFSFEVVNIETDESYPSELTDPKKVVAYIANKKLEGCQRWLSEKLVVTADTLVHFDNHILGKPRDTEDAKSMLQKLANTVHIVTTSVCIGFRQQRYQFSISTKVHFASLSEQQISYYIDKYRPFDKAGSYGIQEWIGKVGISRIEGSYTNVVGLPLHETYKAIIHYSTRWLH